jgi:hypothetical protein
MNNLALRLLLALAFSFARWLHARQKASGSRLPR